MKEVFFFCLCFPFVSFASANGTNVAHECSSVRVLECSSDVASVTSNSNTQTLEHSNTSPVSILIAPSIGSAYLSRAKVIEDRPMQFLFVRADLSLGPLGKIGAWNRDVSSLTDRRDYAHHRAFNEMDWAAFWHYDLALADGWSLANEVQKSWNTYHGYKPGFRTTEHAASEWRLLDSLENPYLTPYWIMRTCVHPYRWTYYQPGVRHAFKLPRGFTLTPRAFAELGDEGLFRNRYGLKPADCSYDNGLAALNVAVELAWKWTDNFTFFVEVSQFDLVSDEARERTKAVRGNPSSRSDLTHCAAGVRCRF